MPKRKIILIIILLIVASAGSWAIWTLREPLERVVNVVSTKVVTRPSFQFAVIGDNHGVNPIYQKAIQELQDQPVEWLINLADTSEYGTRQEFLAVQELEKTLPYPVYHTLGNHDIKAEADGSIFSDVFNQPENIAIDRGQLHLVLLNNANRKIGFSESTLSWLSDDLAKHANKKIILAYHRPFDLPLADITGDDETAASRASNQRLLEIIEPYSVELILTAHVHTFLEYSVGDIKAVVTGGGGDPAQTILGGPAANYFHYLIVTVTEQDITYNVHRIQL